MELSINNLFANNPRLRTWWPAVADSDFPIQNLPFGVYVAASGQAHVATRIYDTLIDLYALAEAGFLAHWNFDISVLAQNTLNPFIALGKAQTLALRDLVARILAEDNPILRDNHPAQATILFPAATAKMLLPLQIGDYTDFYSSREHATNVGIMFRDPANALLPNWLHIPVGYHGRASSIVVSGTPIVRPSGQVKANTEPLPSFAPSARLDFELEMAFVVGKKTAMGERVSTAQADDYIFGLALFNDWSARDIQQWEYVPLGPFLGKNFGSTISPWIVVLEALEPLRQPTPEQSPEPLPYLKFEGLRNYDIQLQVAIQPKDSKEAYTVCNSNFKYMYWNMGQQLAHHTINGCNINIGDLCASGTISGPTPDSFGSMLELSWAGSRFVELGDGSQRKFILDNDTVIMRGFGITPDGVRIGFGTAEGEILPALPL
jgi:fumarylacetoacetase